MVVMKAKKEGKIKAVIFDIGGVLQESKSSYLIGRNRSAKGVHEYVAKKLGISTEVGKGYRVLANISDHGGQEVPHLHFHLFGGEKVGKMVE